MNHRRALVSALSTLLLCGALSVVAWVSPAAAAGNARANATTSAGGGFVTRTGTELTLNGQPWKFAGYNLPCANPFDLSTAALDYYLNDIKANSGANVVRVWFFQSDGGPGNWAPFNRVISALKARGMKAIVTLTNETSTCDEPDLPANTYKTLAWYQTGYASPEGGYTRSFRSYAVAVATHFQDNPAVAFWQLVNEAQAPSLDSSGQLTCDESAATQALRSFGDKMVAAIRKVDTHHLIDLGTEGIGQCGMQDSTDYSYIHAGSVDLCEYHDYGYPASAMPSGMAEAISACSALGKPFFVGESGIPANVGPDGVPASACDPWPSCSPDSDHHRHRGPASHIFRGQDLRRQRRRRGRLRHLGEVAVLHGYDRRLRHCGWRSDRSRGQRSPGSLSRPDRGAGGDARVPAGGRPGHPGRRGICRRPVDQTTSDRPQLGPFT